MNVQQPADPHIRHRHALLLVSSRVPLPPVETLVERIVETAIPMVMVESFNWRMRVPGVGGLLDPLMPREYLAELIGRLRTAGRTVLPHVQPNVLADWLGLDADMEQLVRHTRDVFGDDTNGVYCDGASRWDREAWHTPPGADRTERIYLGARRYIEGLAAGLGINRRTGYIASSEGLYVADLVTTIPEIDPPQLSPGTSDAMLDAIYRAYGGALVQQAISLRNSVYDPRGTGLRHGLGWFGGWQGRSDEPMRMPSLTAVRELFIAATRLGLPITFRYTPDALDTLGSEGRNLIRAGVERRL